MSTASAVWDRFSSASLISISTSKYWRLSWASASGRFRRRCASLRSGRRRQRRPHDRGAQRFDGSSTARFRQRPPHGLPREGPQRIGRMDRAYGIRTVSRSPAMSTASTSNRSTPTLPKASSWNLRRTARGSSMMKSLTRHWVNVWPCRLNSAIPAKRSKAWSANSTPCAARRLFEKEYLD